MAAGAGADAAGATATFVGAGVEGGVIGLLLQAAKSVIRAARRMVDLAWFIEKSPVLSTHIRAGESDP